jgi:hypothetical protein
MEASGGASKLLYKNAMVAVCDILGFKNVLKSSPLEEVVEEDFQILSGAIYFCLHKKNPRQHPLTYHDFQSQGRVGFAWFSDTILLYSLEDTEAGYMNLIESAAWLLSLTITSSNYQLRIGVSYGKVYIDPENHLYLGQPIVDAFLLQEKQEWSGGALTGSAEERIPQEVRDGKFLAPWYLVKYPVPHKLTRKDGFTVLINDQPTDTVPLLGRTPMMALDWTNFFHPFGFNLYWSRENHEPPPSEKRKDVIRKWRHTVEFHDKVCRSCKKVGKQRP